VAGELMPPHLYVFSSVQQLSSEVATHVPVQAPPPAHVLASTAHVCSPAQSAGPLHATAAPLRHGPPYATPTFACCAEHALLYEAPSQPHTGSNISAHAPGTRSHVPAEEPQAAGLQKTVSA
jgi:hypothetical protein